MITIMHKTHCDSNYHISTEAQAIIAEKITEAICFAYYYDTPRHRGNIFPNLTYCPQVIRLDFDKRSTESCRIHHPAWLMRHTHVAPIRLELVSRTRTIHSQLRDMMEKVILARFNEGIGLPRLERITVEIRMSEYDFRYYAGIALKTIIAELQRSLKIYCLEHNLPLVAAQVWQRLCVKARRLEQEVDPYTYEIACIYADSDLVNTKIATEVARV